MKIQGLLPWLQLCESKWNLPLTSECFFYGSLLSKEHQQEQVEKAKTEDRLRGYQGKQDFFKHNQHGFANEKLY